MSFTRAQIAPLLCIGAFAFLMLGCDLFPEAPPENELLDGPIEGLTPEQLGIFMAGDEEFGRHFTAGEGVGPIFIATACISCHPGDGKGHPAFNLTRFGRMSDGIFDPMEADGGPQLQHRSASGFVAEIIPEDATGITRLTPPHVTGVGLLEMVEDATILAMADPFDENGDGISGRPQLIDSTDFIAEIVSLESILAGGPGGRTRSIPIDGKFIGRFGKKALSINLLHQTVTAYSQDMGLTTDLVPKDLVNRQIGGFASDDAPDPEITSNIVSNVVFYLRTLKPPPRRNEDDPAVRAGEQLFAQIGCAGCHVPKLRTGWSDIPVLSETEFYPYTDLLLHDMGPELDDGYTEGIALTSEWKTAPLWGIGLAATTQGGSPHYLHDGRAGSLSEAIQFHGGEAAASRTAFNQLSDQEKEQLIEFLQSL